MPVMDAPWQLVEHLTLKVERAKKHILDLEATWATFFEGAYEVASKDDLHTGERTYYLASVRDIPHEIPLIVGDALSNLRSALDHLAHHLVIVGTGSPGPFPHVYFPIAKDTAEYNTKRDGRIKGMRQDAIDAINAIEPYESGAGKILWHLHCLNNIDKHRLLLTVWANLQGHSILPSQRTKIISQYFGSHPTATDAPNLKGTFIPPDIKRFPLKASDVLLTIPKSEMEEKMQFLLDLAFGEPKIVEGKSVIPTLHEMTTFIRHMVFSFDRLGLL